MADVDFDRVQSLHQAVTPWIHIGLRLGLVALVAKPALSKVLTYGRSVSFFDALGIPAPAILVILAGGIQVGAIVLLLVGVGERLAAISLLPVMVVAILYAGLDWKNVSVLVGAMGLLVLETDVDTLRQPATRVLR